MISSHLNFPCILYIKFWEILIFLAQTVKARPRIKIYISGQTLFCIYSEWISGKFYFLIAEICVISVNKMHGEFTDLHIHIDCSRNVAIKITEILNFTSYLFFIRFTSNFHRCVRFFLLFLLFLLKPGPDFSFRSL